MAPFKLKFRMGSSSRSTSQETETELQAHSLLNNTPAALRTSSTTIDSEHNSEDPSTNDQRALIGNSHGSDGVDSIGITNPVLTHAYTDSTDTIPLSPPPSYDHVLEENRLAALDIDNNPTTIHWSYRTNPTANINVTLNIINENIQLGGGNGTDDNNDSPIFSCSTMTSPSQENLLECNGSCDLLFSAHSGSVGGADRDNDDDQRTSNTCDDERCSEASENDNNSDAEWNSHEHLQQHHNLNHHQQQQQHHSDYQLDYNQQQQNTMLHELSSPEILSNKSSKELYKAVAKEWGITCKMSDQCRCMECQSHYFDCEFDENDHQKTDGGLGAGTPMFISEVMHGTACTIL